MHANVRLIPLSLYYPLAVQPTHPSIRCVGSSSSSSSSEKVWQRAVEEVCELSSPPQ
jgi:hypothetical protein